MVLRDAFYWKNKVAQLSLHDKAYIDGKFVPAQDGGVLEVIDPSTGTTLAHVADCQQADVDLAVAAARRAYESGVWSGLHPRERGQRLLALSTLIQRDIEEFALLETLNVGKPITESLMFDLPEAIKTYAWYGEAVDKIYDQIAPTGSNALATVTREPLGVIAAVVPWNYPLLMASWKIAPALASGNCIVVKPSELTPLSLLKLSSLMEEAGLPAGVFNVVPGTGPVAGQALGLHNDVDCLTFTGSTATGKRFMEYSGQSNLKRVWLECGGKSPHIVFDDCPDLDKAAMAAAVGITSNQGEVCIAGSRLYVQEGIYDDFMKRVSRCVQNIRPGDPLDPNTVMGAIVDERQMNKVLSYIESGKKEGASLRLGGQRVRTETGGYYIEPTIFDCPSDQLSIINEEIFGPVLSARRFNTEEEVIACANDSIYGLGAGLWTANLGRAHRVSRKLRAGLVWVNCFFDSDITVPFGGVKQSGSGRDKSLHALDKYTDLKTSWFNLDASN